MDSFIDMREYRDIYTQVSEMPVTEGFLFDLTNLYRMSDKITSQVELGANVIGYTVLVKDNEKLLT